jgi:hypothetical protein
MIELKITHVRNLNNWHLYSSIKELCCKVFFPYNHNLVRVYMECDNTCLNHNSLVSKKKMVTKAVIIEGVYYSCLGKVKGKYEGL